MSMFTLGISLWPLALTGSPGSPESLLKLWAMLCGAIQDGWVMVECSDKTWSTGEGNGKPRQHSCFEMPMNSMKRQKDRTLKDELPRSVGSQYATGDKWRNNSRKSEAAAAKSLQSCLTLCDPIDSRPPGSPIPGNLQARILEWVRKKEWRDGAKAKTTPSCGWDW